MEHHPWDSWRDPTTIEKQLMPKVEEAQKRIVEALPTGLYAIYVKGSFVRREARNQSDVDMVPIVTEDQYQAAAFSVNHPDISPVMVIPLSLEEFKTNSLHTAYEGPVDLRAEPDLFLKELDNYTLIYGQALRTEDYPTRDAQSIVRDERYKILHGYIPAYEQGICSMKALAKEVFWLAEWELRAQDRAVQHSFASILASSDKDHPVQYAQRIRSGKEDHIDEFLSQLKNYLKE